MDTPPVFADAQERASLGRAPERRLQRRSGPRLWRLMFLVGGLLGLVLVVVLHGHAALADSLVIADRERQANQILSSPAWPDAFGPLPSPAAAAVLASGGWLGACEFGQDASARAVAWSAPWTAQDCPPRPDGLPAASGDVVTQALGAGRHAVWSRGQGGVTDVAMVFATDPASGLIEHRLRQSTATRAWIIAVLLVLAGSVLLPQALALVRLQRNSALAAQRGGRSPLQAGGGWVCEELCRLHEHMLEMVAQRQRQAVLTNEALELLRQTWHVGSESVLIVDAHGVVSFVNPAAQALLSEVAANPLGRDIAELLPATSAEVLTARAGDPERDRWGVRLVRADGTALDVEVLVTLLAIEEQPVFHVCLKPRIASAPAAPVAKPAPEQLLANVSHEIRTPLNGIIGTTDLLADTPLQADQQELVATLRTSTRQLRALLNDILDLSRFAAGEMRLESIPFDICAQVKRCVDAFVAAAQRKQLKLNLRLDVPHLVVVGDPLRVAQVLNNLLDNAIKFTPQGAVKVHLAVDAPPGEGADVRVRLDVADTGIGVADGFEAGIFEPFRQADGSMTRQYGGSGLGLALCRDLCRAMNGGIALMPAAGRGSIFSVWLDLQRGDIATAFVDTLPVEQAEEGVSLKGRRALVADDNRINQMLLTRWLQHEGVEVELAVDGEQAVRRASEGGLDIILMDLSMPVMNGLDATRTIRQLAGRPLARRNELATLPIIGVTAHAMPGDREACISSGMDDYITKPLRRHELVQIMANAVRRHEASAGTLAKQAE